MTETATFRGTTITKLGLLAHQICYSVKTPSGPSNTFKTLRAADKWISLQERVHPEWFQAKPIA